MADKGEPAPARLFVHLAREAPVGVILRRGSTEWVQIIVWHTDTDKFEFGQWFHGRIKERVCDVSPDGSFLLYFATDYSREIPDAPHALESMWKWTSISRPPYLTALALWPNFDQGDSGGGCFVDENTICLYGEERETIPARGAVPHNMKVVRALALQEMGVERLSQDSLNGWHVVQDRVWQYPPGRALKPEVLRKDRDRAGYSLLQKTEDFHRYQYALLDHMTGSEISLDGGTWADFDHSGRITFAKDGKLFGIEPSAILESATEIADFNDQRFSPLIAPESETELDRPDTQLMLARAAAPPGSGPAIGLSARLGVRSQAMDLGWILGMIQYGVSLAGGGAIWFLIAHNTDFFGGDPLAQSSACLLLLALVVAEAGWIHMPGRNDHMGDYIADFLSSGAIVAFGMGVALFIGLSLPH